MDVKPLLAFRKFFFLHVFETVSSMNFYCRALTTQAHLTQEERNTVGTPDNLILISVGLEETKDLQQDLEQALAGARN